ncbi:MAG: hypothetical protein QXX33_05425, partial [Candidatus Hadarchaeales archaeon]
LRGLSKANQISHTHPTKAETVSGIATLLTTSISGNSQLAAAQRKRREKIIAERCCLARISRKIESKITNARETKKRTEKRKCIFPKFSLKTPTKTRKIPTRMVDAETDFQGLRALRNMSAEKMTIMNPEIASPALKIMP